MSSKKLLERFFGVDFLVLSSTQLNSMRQVLTATSVQAAYRESGEDNAVFGLNLKKSVPKSDCSGLLELTLEGNDLNLAPCSRDHQHTSYLDTVEGGDDGCDIRFALQRIRPQKHGDSSTGR